MKTPKEKILFLLHLPPPVHGSSMVGQWIKDSDAINCSFECRYINMLASKTVHESGKVSVGKIIGFIKTWFILLSTLIFHKPQVVYFALTTTGAAFYRDVLLIGLLRLFGVKRIYHLHNKGIKNQKGKWNDLLYLFVFKNAEVIILSEYLYDDIKNYVSRNKVHICPNGIPPSDNIMYISEKRKDTITILFLSNLIESKGVFVLLEAMALLKQKGVAFNGVFVGGEGDISEKRFRERVKLLQLGDNVSYLGKKYGAAKERIFEQADIFAFPTYYYYETFGLVNLEAMQHSLPVISTYEGGIPDIIEEGITGFLVPQKDAVALADRLDILIKNSELRKSMGQAGRKKYENEFTLEKFENRMVKIFTEIVDNQELKE